jgi:hypothetical protein
VLARRAWTIALAGIAVSPVLMISDLGRPGRFVNMLRMFKVTSPMNVGVVVAGRQRHHHCGRGGQRVDRAVRVADAGSYCGWRRMRAATAAGGGCGQLLRLAAAVGQLLGRAGAGAPFARCDLGSGRRTNERDEAPPLT